MTEQQAIQIDVIVGNLIREGINKHRARELAEHFIKHTFPQPADEVCQCPACKVAPHASDCDVHSEPAYAAGQCNCGASGEPVAWQWQMSGIRPDIWQVSDKPHPDAKYKRPLYASPQKQPPVIDKSVARRIATQLGWSPPRTWVEMTPEDRNQCLKAGNAHGWIGVMEATEAILKEKNT